MLDKIQKEINRLGKKLFRSGAKDKRIETLQSALDNLPYELLDGRSSGKTDIYIPAIKTIDETLDEIITGHRSIARFGDGEFNVMNEGRIHFQERSPEIARRLKETLTSDDPRLLVALVDTFGSLAEHTPPGAEFWRKWMSRKRKMVYEYLDRNRVYYNALFTRPYVIFNKSDEHYRRCGVYFNKVKRLWAGRDVLICEGEGTRFGLNNDLLEGAASIRRILCPARSAYNKYDAIVSAFDTIEKNVLVLAALGPTATVLAHDLCKKGFQTLDIGHLDIEYEWFLRKDTEGRVIPFKYVDGSEEGRQVHKLEHPEYERQIIRRIV